RDPNGTHLRSGLSRGDDGYGLGPGNGNETLSHSRMRGHLSRPPSGRVLRSRILCVTPGTGPRRRLYLNFGRDLRRDGVAPLPLPGTGDPDAITRVRLDPSRSVISGRGAGPPATHPAPPDGRADSPLTFSATMPSPSEKHRRCRRGLPSLGRFLPGPASPCDF